MDTLSSKTLTCLGFGQRGITPAFGYSAPYLSAGGTLTLLINALPSAHYEQVRLPIGTEQEVMHSLPSFGLGSLAVLSVPPGLPGSLTLL